MGGDYLDLPTIDNDPILSRIVVPPNMYATVQSLLKKSERRSAAQEDLCGLLVYLSQLTRTRDWICSPSPDVGRVTLMDRKAEDTTFCRSPLKSLLVKPCLETRLTRLRGSTQLPTAIQI